MTPHTLAFKDVETKTVGELAQYAQTYQYPLMLTKDKTSEAVMILMSPHTFETFQHNTDYLRERYKFQLLYLLQELDKVERLWGDRVVQEAFIKKMPKLTFKLWKLCPDHMKRVCMSLDLSAKRLRIDSLTLAMVDALRQYIDLICEEELDKDKILSAKRKLISVGLPPRMGGSQELVELYLEEL